MASPAAASGDGWPTPSLNSGIALFVAPLTVEGLADQVGIRVAYGIVPALLSAALIGTVLSLVLRRRPSPTT